MPYILSDFLWFIFSVEPSPECITEEEWDARMSWGCYFCLQNPLPTEKKIQTITQPIVSNGAPYSAI